MINGNWQVNADIKAIWGKQQGALYIETVENEIRYYMNLEDYVHARSSLNSFVPTEWIADEWETKKIALNEEINAKEAAHEANAKKPVPMSSKDFENTQYDEAETELKKAGFTNITLEKIPYKSTWYRKTNPGDVKEISIEVNGKTVNSFKKDDVFQAASKITITYYDVE